MTNTKGAWNKIEEALVDALHPGVDGEVRSSTILCINEALALIKDMREEVPEELIDVLEMPDLTNDGVKVLSVDYKTTHAPLWDAAALVQKWMDDD